MEQESVEDIYGQYFRAPNGNYAAQDEYEHSTDSDNEALPSTDSESEDDVHLIEPEEQIPSVDNYQDEDVRKVYEFCCGCTQANKNSPCSTLFEPEELIEMRREAYALNYYDQNHCNRLDIVILGQLRALCCSSEKTKRSHRNDNTVRKRTRTTYQLKGQVVCKRTFFFAFGISKMRFRRLLKTYYEEGVCEKPHGSAKNKNAVHMPDATLQNIVQFLRNYAIQHALFLPSRMAVHRDVAVKLLPSGETKKHIYHVYCECCQDDVSKIVPLCSFRKIWKTFCPEIVLQKPLTDLCDFCQKNFVSMQKLAGKSDEEKLEQIMVMKAHLQKAEEERKYYNASIERTKLDPTFAVLHFSFDMAQRVFLPSNPLQPSSIYFLVPFRVGIFGVMCDTLGRQVNYLLPESVELSEGSNTVVNLLYHNFRKGYEKVRELSLHADNCIGQNEKNLVLFFLNFLILTDACLKIEFNFMVKGHTRFSCDRCFGLLKKKYRKCSCSTLNDLTDMIEQSTPESHTNKAEMVANEAGDLLLDMFDWTKFFTAEKWNKIPLITTYSHIVLSSVDPGAVHCRIDLNSDPQHFFIGILSSPEAHPEPLHVDRFGLERQAYLYKEIRPFCTTETADTLCPQPPSVQPQPGASHQPAAPLPQKESNIPQHKRGRPLTNETILPFDEEAVDDPELMILKRKRGHPYKNEAILPVDEKAVDNPEV